MSKQMSRREALRLGLVASAGASGLVLTVGGREVVAARSTLAPKNTPVPYTAPFRRPPVLLPAAQGTDATGPFAHYRLTQKLGLASIVPGLTTTIAGYNGIFPGPTIRVPQGTRTEVRISNALNTSPFHAGQFSTVTHLHGSASLPQYDGYANDRTFPGFVKTYHYPNWQPARSLWYHDHDHHFTAQNVFAGLAGQYHLSDRFERAQLPQGEFDVTLMVSDMSFDASGNVLFDDTSHAGFMGDTVLVNGVPWPVMKVKPRVYRFRVLTAGISRSWRFTLGNGEPVHLVATDAGMTPVVEPLASWRQGVAERYEVLIDFRKYKPGTRIELKNLSNKNNVDFADTGKVMMFEVVADAGPKDPFVIPRTLDTGPQPFANRGAIDVMELRPDQATARRRLRFERDHGLWTVNGVTWDDVERSNFQKVFANPQPYDIEIIELVNQSGGWFHPVHLHLVDARIIARNTTPDGKPFAWEKGPKDVFYLGENESVTVLTQYTVGDGNAGGRYMTHCHNLVHEDADMMVQFAVGDKNVNDPVTSDPPVRETEPEIPPVYAPGFPLGT
jgi:spore coat protein A